MAAKKVLVTGATGFIGNYVVRELLDRGLEVIASSKNESKAQNLSWFNKVSYRQFDLKQSYDNANLFHYFNSPDVIIHLAWEGLPNYNNEFHIKENLYAHKKFFLNFIKQGIQNITITGTCFEYGMQEGMLKEDMPVYPDNNYAIAKNELRKYIEELKKSHPFSFKWLRLFYMYGEGQNPKSLVPQLNAAINKGAAEFNMSGGKQVRDFLPIELVAQFIVNCALQTKIDSIINISSNNPTTVKNFVEDYLKKRNANIHLNLGYYPYTDFEPMSFWGNNDKLKMINKIYEQ